MNKYIYHSYKDLKRTHIPALKSFVKWTLISILIGVVVGLIGSAFNYSIKEVSSIRERYPIIIMFMAFGGVAITWIYWDCLMIEVLIWFLLPSVMAKI